MLDILSSTATDPAEETAIFDVDKTVHPASPEMEQMWTLHVGRYLSDILGTTPLEAQRYAIRQLARYGSTLRGILEDGIEVDPEEYMRAIHDIDITPYIHPDPRLDRELEELPLRKIAFTNGSHEHASRILARVGIVRHFPRIFHFAETEWWGKPHRIAFEKFIGATGVNPGRSTFFDDSLANLRMAREIGMRTVLVGELITDAAVDVAIADIHDARWALERLGVLPTTVLRV